MKATTAQNVLTVLEASALAAIALVRLRLWHVAQRPPLRVANLSVGAFGLAMVLILLTYGGWNEAAYISADLKNVKRDMIRILADRHGRRHRTLCRNQYGLSCRARP